MKYWLIIQRSVDALYEAAMIHLTEHSFKIVINNYNTFFQLNKDTWKVCILISN